MKNLRGGHSKLNKQSSAVIFVVVILLALQFVIPLKTLAKQTLLQPEQNRLENLSMFQCTSTDPSRPDRTGGVMVQGTLNGDNILLSLNLLMNGGIMDRYNGSGIRATQTSPTEFDLGFRYHLDSIHHLSLNLHQVTSRGLFTGSAVVGASPYFPAKKLFCYLQ